MPGTGSVTRPSRSPIASVNLAAALRDASINGVAERIRLIESLKYARIGYYTNFNDGKPLVEGSDVGHDIPSSWDATAAGIAAKAIGQGCTQLLLAGTNMTDALATWATGGGLTLTTATADNDAAYMIPNSDSDVANAFTEKDWDLDRQGHFLSVFKTGAAVTTTGLFHGFKIDNDFGTDDVDICGFFVDTEADNTIKLVATRNSVGLFGGSVTYDTEKPLEASTAYHFEIAIGSDGYPVFWIDDEEYDGAGSVLSMDNSLRGGTSGVHPFWGHTCTAGSAARALTYRYIGASEVFE